MSFQREYDRTVSLEWNKPFNSTGLLPTINSFLYYEDYDILNEETRQMMQQSMVAFGGIAPTYHIALLDKPTIIWISFAAGWDSDDVQLHADGQRKPDPALQTTAPKPLSQSRPKRCILQPSVQE